MTVPIQIHIHASKFLAATIGAANEGKLLGAELGDEQATLRPLIAPASPSTEYDDADFLPGALPVITDPAELAKSAAILEGRPA